MGELLMLINNEEDFRLGHIHGDKIITFLESKYARQKKFFRSLFSHIQHKGYLTNDQLACIYRDKYFLENYYF